MNKVQAEKLKNKPTWRNILKAVVFCTVLLVASGLFFNIAANYNGINIFIPEDGVVLGLRMVPILLIAGLYGYLVSSIVFSIAFIISLIFKMEYSYTMIIYMASMACFSLCAQFRMLATKLKTFIMCTVTILAILFNEYLCYVVVDGLSSSEFYFKDISFFNYKVIFSVYFVGIILYLYFKYSKDEYKSPFPISYLYTESYAKDLKLNKKHKQTKISAKITTIIILLLFVLGVSVAFFMMVLFSDMKKIFVNYSLATTPSYGGYHEYIQQDAINNIRKMEYVADDTMLAFDLKMIILMVNVGIPIAGIATFYTKMTICAPVGTMSDFMEHYATATDEDKILYGHNIEDIEVKTHDELQVLYEAINETVYAVEAYIQRIEEKQRLEVDLEIAKKASVAKSSFLSNMSHEIRTPINAILGMNEMILRESEEENTREYAVNIKSAGSSLLSLVNDILDFSKIEAGKMEILPVQYNLGSLINDLVNMVSSRAKEKGLELIVEVDKEIPANLVGDEIRLKQVVTNLLTNSVKYTEKGKVILSVSYDIVDEENIKLRFEVADTGMGIKNEDLRKLFSPFERIDETRNRTIEGTGLGMSIVKKTLEMMDSSLVVDSKYGFGSIFTFGVNQKVISWNPIGDFKEMYREYIDSVERYHESFTAPEAEILVVDDTEMNLTVIKSLLKRTQIKITTLNSGRETIDLVTKKRFDVIFLDHRMPNMDGIETYEVMKVLPNNKNKDVPVIALTANAVSGAREEYMKHGFTDYLSKPINSIQLENMLLHYLPPEKIQSVSISNGKDDYEPQSMADIAGDSLLTRLKDVDLKAGINNCGDVDTYTQVVKDFYISIDGKADAIEGFLKEKDLRNYTVLVHALKSSARLIGALDLSKMAEELEELGNKGDYIAIQEKNDVMIAKYLSYKDSLAAIDDSGVDKQPISKDEVENAFKDIKELVEAYDYDTADSIMNMLEGYNIPDDIKEKYMEVKKLMVDVNRDKLLEIL